MLREFKEFIANGNVFDLAVGVIIGGAFGKIVGSLVDDVIMPPIGKMLGGVNFADMKAVLTPAVLDAAGKVTTPEVALKYGAFIQNSLQFVIIAFVVFLLVKAYNKMRAAAPPPPPTSTDALLGEIRDVLKAK